MKNLLFIVLVLFAAVFLAFSPFLTPLEGTNEFGWTSVALLVIAVTLWLTNVIPAPVTGLLVIALSSLFGVLTFEEAASGLGKEVTWLILAMLFIGAALENTGLDKRIAFRMLSWAGGKVRLIVLMLILFTLILTFFIPNAVGRVAVLLPISLGIVKALSGTCTENYAKIVFLTNTFVPIVTCSGLITGSSATIYAVGLFDDILAYQWDYLYWLAVMMPPVVITLLVFWLLIFNLFPLCTGDEPRDLDFIQSELKKMGSLSIPEKKLIFIYAFLVAFWATKQFTGISLTLPALLASILLFLPKVDLLDWQEAKKKVDWGIPLIFTAGFTIALMLKKNGIIGAMARLIDSSFGGISPYLTAFCMMILLIGVRLVFNNDSPMVASLLPVILTFARATPFNPLWLGMIAVISCNLGYFFPTQSVPSMMAFSAGYLGRKDFFVTGFALTVLMIIFTLLSAFFYWPLIGLKIY